VFEQVNGYGEQPGSAGFVFGDATALIRGMVIATGTPRHRVPPNVWGVPYGLKGKKKDEKKSASRIAACQLFPTEAHRFALVKHHGRSDATLLAHFGATKILGYVP
jgi:hypothetical protein